MRFFFSLPPAHVTRRQQNIFVEYLSTTKYKTNLFPTKTNAMSGKYQSIKKAMENREEGLKRKKKEGREGILLNSRGKSSQNYFFGLL